MKKSILIASVLCFVLLLISNTSYHWSKWTSWFILIGVGLFITLIIMNVFSFIKLSQKNKNFTNFISPIIYTSTIALTLLYPGGIIDYEQFKSEIILTAEGEDTTNYGNRLTFRKDGSIEQKGFYNYEEGYYERNLDCFLIYGLNDTNVCDIAKLIEYKDAIGHLNKKLLYYSLGDTLINPFVYKAFDAETKCIDHNQDLDSTDYSFLIEQVDSIKLLDFELQKGSVKIKRDYRSMGASYYPLFNKYPIGSPVAFMRKFKGGIPLETLYYYSNNSLMVQYYQWSDLGCICLEDLSNKDFENLFNIVKENIVKQKGKPINIIKKKKSVIIIWDSDEEHIELHLYLYGGNRIRLINYWKASTTPNNAS